MPCRSDYMEPSGKEIESKRVLEFLKEVGLLQANYKIDYYGETKNLDLHTSMLCGWCQENDVTKKSLELQIWWRDHQAADKRRIEREIKAIREKKDREK
jgi:hypothetical protein